jgi:hypothetical protein
MLKKIFYGFMAAAAVLVLAVSVYAPPPLPQPQLTADPANYTGPCPVTITFKAEILPPPLPGPVKYKFIRSDGADSPEQELKFLLPQKKTVTTTWTLSRDYNGWVQLRILTPGHIDSNKAYFRVKCQTSGSGTSGAESAAGQNLPKRFFLDFVDAYLVYVPSSSTLQIATENMVLSYGDGWDKCQLKPYLYHLRRSDWDNFFWQVNTSRKEVIQINGGEFCSITKGTSRKKLDITVDVVGGQGDTQPDRFFLRFSKSYLAYEPGSDVFQIIGQLTVLSRGEDWERCRIYPYLYNLKLKTWKDFHWKVNTSRKQAWKTAGGTFCQIGGSDSELKMGVRVVD